MPGDINNVYHVYGPPGTGKTTYLIRQMQNSVDKGNYEPEEVGLVSLTRAA